MKRAEKFFGSIFWKYEEKRERNERLTKCFKIDVAFIGEGQMEHSERGLNT